MSRTRFACIYILLRFLCRCYFNVLLLNARCVVLCVCVVRGLLVRMVIKRFLRKRGKRLISFEITTKKYIPPHKRRLRKLFPVRVMKNYFLRESGIEIWKISVNSREARVEMWDRESWFDVIYEMWVWWMGFGRKGLEEILGR